MAMSDVLLPVLETQLASYAPPTSIAVSNVVLQWVSLLPAIGIAQVLGLFPDGEVQRRYERSTLRLTWLILVIPVVLLVCSNASAQSGSDTPAECDELGLAPYLG